MIKFFLYTPGVIPSYLLKVLINTVLLKKPFSSAICLMLLDEFFKSSFALSTLILEIYSVIEGNTITLNEICKKLNRKPNEVSSILTFMEIEGYIEQKSGQNFKVKER